MSWLNSLKTWFGLGPKPQVPEQKEVVKKEITENDLALPKVKTDIFNMSKKEIEQYAQKEFGVELDRRKRKANMIDDLDKVQIEKFARDNYGIELDRRFSRENMVERLVRKLNERE